MSVSFRFLDLQTVSCLWRAVLASLIALAPLAANAAPPTRPVSVTYDMTIAGLPMGTVSLDGIFTGNLYQLHLTSEFTGLIGLFFAYTMHAESGGIISGEKVLPTSYKFDTDRPKKPQHDAVGFAGGNAVSISLDPPMPDKKDRVPVLPEHKMGVVDPLSGVLIPIKAKAPMDSENCNHTSSVFDGGTRFDVAFSSGHTGSFRTEGYSGPVLVCAVRYTPIAGHRDNKSEVTFMANNRDIEARFASFGGERVLVPLEISVATMVGTFKLVATHVSGDVTSDLRAANP